MDTIPLWYVEHGWYRDASIQEPVIETSMDVMDGNTRVQFDTEGRPVTIGYTHFYSMEEALEYLRDDIAEDILRVQRGIAEAEALIRKLTEDQQTAQEKYTRVMARLNMIRAAVGFDDDTPTARVRRLGQP